MPRLRRLSPGQVIGGALVVLILAAPTLAWAAADVPAFTPSDPAAFTAAVAERLTALLPGARVVAEGPLTLGVTSADSSGETQANLRRVFDFCTFNIDQCDEAITAFVRGAADTFKEMNQPVDVSMLRLAMRPSAYVKTLWSQLGSSQANEPVSMPFSADLAWVLVVDTPNATRMLLNRDLTALALTSDQAMDAGRRNVEATLRPLASVTQSLPTKGIGVITGDYYESSLLIAHDAWAKVAARMSGPLLVAVPDPGTVLYADGGGDAHALDALRSLAHDWETKSQKPLSATIFQWTADGWRPAGLDTAAPAKDHR